MKTKGFALKAPPRIGYQTYTAELKRRYLSDSSEVLLGTMTIRVPKKLNDPTGQTLTKREVWDAFAQAVCYCLICSKAGEEKGCNQIFLFDSRWNLLERLETNTWQENGTAPTHQEPMNDETASIAWEAFKRCEVQVDWLDVPLVA